MGKQGKGFQFIDTSLRKFLENTFHGKVTICLNHVIV